MIRKLKRQIEYNNYNKKAKRKLEDDVKYYKDRYEALKLENERYKNANLISRFEKPARVVAETMFGLKDK